MTEPGDFILGAYYFALTGLYHLGVLVRRNDERFCIHQLIENGGSVREWEARGGPYAALMDDEMLFDAVAGVVKQLSRSFQRETGMEEVHPVDAVHVMGDEGAFFAALTSKSWCEVVLASRGASA